MIIRRETIVKKCARFYKELYAISKNAAETNDNLNKQGEEKPPLTENEIINALKKMKRLKAKDDNGLITKILKEREKTVFLFMINKII